MMIPTRITFMNGYPADRLVMSVAVAELDAQGRLMGKGVHLLELAKGDSIPEITEGRDMPTGQQINEQAIRSMLYSVFFAAKDAQL